MKRLFASLVMLGVIAGCASTDKQQPAEVTESKATPPVETKVAPPPPSKVETTPVQPPKVTGDPLDPLDDLRGRMAVVTQDIYLFRRTVRENIRLARPEATDADVEAACRRAIERDPHADEARFLLAGLGGVLWVRRTAGRRPPQA